MSTFIVAGGAGFIGSHLCKRLLEQKNRVICIDNLITGSEDNVSSFFQSPNFVFVNCDVIRGLPKLADKIAGIFHLASPASPNIKSPKSYLAFPLETLMVNSQGTKNLLDLACANSAKFVYASSSEIYGDPKVSPQKESYFGNINPNGPRSVYDEGKRFGEAITMAYRRQYDLDVRIVRIFNTYGEKMQKDDGRVVSNFINQAISGNPLTVYGDGSQTRSFCYITDLIDGLVKVMDKDEVGERVVNLGNPEEYRIIDLAKKIKEKTGSNSEILFEDLPPDDPHQRKPDILLAKETFGFNPKIKLEEGLAKTIEYFKDLNG